MVIDPRRRGQPGGSPLAHVCIEIALVVILTARVTGVFPIAFALALSTRFTSDSRAFASGCLLGHVRTSGWACNSWVVDCQPGSGNYRV